MIIILLNERCVQIVTSLANNSCPVKISDIAQKFKVSSRTIRYDLDSIDQFLKENSINELQRTPNVGVILPVMEEEKRKIVHKLTAINTYDYALSQEERRNLILSELMQQKDYITINQLADEIMVSRGTIIKDLGKVREWLEKHSLQLQSVSKHGLRIDGSEKKIRQGIIELLSETIDLNKALDFVKTSDYRNVNVGMDKELKKLFQGIEIEFIENCLKIAEQELQTIFSDDAFLELLINIAISIKRIKLGKEIVITEGEINSLRITKELAAASNLAKMFEEHFDINMCLNEIAYMALNLLGSSVTAAKLNEKENWIEFQLLTRDIIEKVSRRINMDLTKDKQLFDGFLEHLRPAVYRVRNGLKVKNPLLKEIKDSFLNVFEAVKENAGPIEGFAEGTFDEEEIGYLTMHFGASMERMKNKPKAKKNILVVCGSGIGTAKLLSAKLQSIFDVNIVDTIAYHQVSSVLQQKKNIDLIVSTFPILAEGIVSINVGPMLTEKDIELLDKYLDSLERPEITVDEVLSIIERHCVINDKNSLTKELSCMFNVNDYIIAKGVAQPMLKDLLTENTIKLKVDASDWEDAVRKGGELLEKEGSIEHGYIDAMVNSVKEIGPYIVIAPGIAMPHARPEAGTKKIGMSLMTLNNPVNFGNEDNDPVTIVVCLCAIDHSTHLKAMAELVGLLGDDAKVEKIKAAERIDDILCLIQNGEN